jgi:hypothetical protein
MSVWLAIPDNEGMVAILARLWHLVFKGSNYPGIFLSP